MLVTSFHFCSYSFDFLHPFCCLHSLLDASPLSTFSEILYTAWTSLDSSCRWHIYFSEIWGLNFTVLCSSSWLLYRNLWVLFCLANVHNSILLEPFQLLFGVLAILFLQDVVFPGSFSLCFVCCPAEIVCHAMPFAIRSFLVEAILDPLECLRLVMVQVQILLCEFSVSISVCIQLVVLLWILNSPILSPWVSFLASYVYLCSDYCY